MEHVDVAAEHFACRVAEQPFGRTVERLDAPVGVDEDDAVDGRVDDRPPASLARPQRALEVHAPGQVAQHPRELPLTGDPHFPDRQMHRKERAVSPPPGHLTARTDDPRLAGREVPLEIRVVLLMMRRRHQDADVPPDHFLIGIPEQLLRTTVEGFDLTASVDDDDAIDGHVENGVEALGAPHRQRRRGAQRLLRLV
jgi:hypothetical protein